MSAGAFEFPPMGQLLRRLGIRLAKGRSQHFLRRQEISAAIAGLCGLTPAHEVLEVGTGLGNLTTELARRAGRVVTVEADESFKEWHQTLLGAFSNLEIQYGDFLRVPTDSLLSQDWKGPRVAAGNLPYHITGPILFRLVSEAKTWERIVLMVQWEVADRLAAGPATRRSGALTYKIALEYSCRIALKIPAGEFIPPPKVQSAVVVLEPLAEPLVRDLEHRGQTHRVLTGIFLHRRRTLANALALGALDVSKADAEKVLRIAGIDSARRPETLTLPEVLRLTDAVIEIARPSGDRTT